MIDSITGLSQILRNCRTIAVVGLSAQWHRPSYFAAKYLLDKGYEVIPVNPRENEILGQKCYPDLSAVPVAVDAVDCFRRVEEMPALAKQAAAIGARVFWMQLGVQCDIATKIAEDAGLMTVGDRCMKIEHGRLFGGLGFVGVNTGVISPRRRNAQDSKEWRADEKNLQENTTVDKQ
ncbi:MAG: CoA-binding protein [Gammaproteobacteria bacterium WSBS_2016_MAG_OTU1]